MDEPAIRSGAVAACVAIDGRPNVGARGADLRVHDVITLELFQPPPGR